MNDKLKPCPFCASKDVHIEVDGDFAWGECYACGARSGDFRLNQSFNPLQRIDGARLKWNGRPLEDSQVAAAKGHASDWKETALQLSKNNGEYSSIIEATETMITAWRQVARDLADELAEANAQRFPVSWEDASEASPAWIAYVNLRDREDHG